MALFFSLCTATAFASEITCWFPPGWNKKPQAVKAITGALSEKSGITVKPKLARSYPEILTAFSSGAPNLVYVGSFVQAIIDARGLGTPLTQSITGKELYGSWMIHPKGEDPQAILEKHPDQIAFAKGASSGESGAKAATSGKAAIAMPKHGASARAVVEGKAKAAFVKNWWWESNKAEYPTLEAYQVPGISDLGNPDNILTASNAVSAANMEKLTAAAKASRDAFGAQQVILFSGNFIFSRDLMEMGEIDPLTYSW